MDSATTTWDAVARLLCRPWRLERVLDVRGPGPDGHLVGTVWWRREPETPGRLRYEETGTLRLGAAELACTRALWFEPGPGVPGPGSIAVRFADGRPFYTLEAGALLEPGRRTVTHLCGQDRYEGSIGLDDDGSFHERWDVSGPNKDYTSTTILRPMAHPDGISSASGPDLR